MSRSPRSHRLWCRKRACPLSRKSWSCQDISGNASAYHTPPLLHWYEWAKTGNFIDTEALRALIARNECLGVAFLHGGFSAYEFKGCCMVQTWSGWKRFPDAQSGDHVEAPIGPGVYEVRHTLTGRVVAFGHAANVAHALSDLKLNGGVGTFARLFRKQPLVSRVSDLEYRTCAAATRAEAKTP